MGFSLLLGIFITLGILFDGGAVIKRLLNSRDTAGSDQAGVPREILDTRLARGEIDLDEYRNIRNQVERTEVIL